MTDLVSLQATLYTSRNSTRRWLHTTRRDLVIEAIKTAPVQNVKRAMEVGPGSGVYLPALCERFDSVVAIDIEASHIVQLRKTIAEFRNLEFMIGDLKDQQWTEGFDLALCSEVIEHVADSGSFVTGLARAVRPGGILILSTPQPWSTMELVASIALSPPVIGLTRWIYKEPVLPTGHISVMSDRKVRRLLQEHDFELLSSNYFGLYLPIIAEFGGKRAVSILRSVERSLQRLGPRGLLWTQLHVARKR